MPYAMHLGLTLSAGTIPLFAVVVGIAMTVNSAALAALPYGFALYLVAPTLDLSVDTMSMALGQASLLGIGMELLAGFVNTFRLRGFSSLDLA